jgi:asparagine synthase (glutamine-hydrolysing)
MSGFAGVWNIDGRPPDRELIAALESKVAHRGERNAHLWCVDGFGCAARVRRVGARSLDERQPLTDPEGNALVFDGRLDNRDDLLRQLRGTRLTSDSPDAALVFEAFREWGDACLERLAGDFALATFRAEERRLVLARDPVGCRPLYYWFDGKACVFASEIKAILAHPDVRAEPNHDLLADFVLRDHLPYEDEGETFFRGVHAVLPGYQLSLSSRGVVSRQFWDFNPQLQTRYRSYSDYAARLRELLIQAVQRRLRTSAPAVIAVSGGLDSSVVLCLADDLRKSGAITAPLVPVSYTGEHDRHSDEQQALHTLESTRQLRIERVSLAPVDRELLTPVAWHSEWPRVDDGWCARRPLFVRARRIGARTIVTGHWSDQLLFATGYLTDLCTRFAWRRIGDHLRAYTEWFVDADPAYFRSRFRRELLLNLTPHEWRMVFRRFLKSRSPEWSRGLASPTLAARLDRPRVRIRRPRCASAHARDIYQFVRAKSHRLQFEADEKLAASWGLDSVTPFLDRDLIAYLMSIPGDVQNHNGVPRALLRDAMRGIVAESILERRWRDEGSALSAARATAYVSPPIALDAASRLGLVQDARPVERASLELLGLEFWSQAFFSDRLAPLRTSPHGVTEPMDTVVTPGADEREKLPYSPPRLVVHGDLRTLTAAKQSDRTEAGQPKTFSSGMP